jgi:hypothetical protein
MTASSKPNANQTADEAVRESEATTLSTNASSGPLSSATIPIVSAPVNGAAMIPVTVELSPLSLTITPDPDGNYLLTATTRMILRTAEASARVATTGTPHTPNPADGTKQGDSDDRPA